MCLMKTDSKMTFTGGGWFTTFSGLQICPTQPDPEKINIRDIAQALSNVCRFGGHCLNFYSVAQHSVYVSENCAPEDALYGLLHDASEAYLSDIVRPVKYTAEMAPYREIEANLERAIVEKFNLGGWPMPPSVKEADDLVLLCEAYNNFRPTPSWVIDGLRRKYNTDKPPIIINEFWPPAIAKARFMKRFFELSGFTVNYVTNEELDKEFNG